MAWKKHLMILIIVLSYPGTILTQASNKKGCKIDVCFTLSRSLTIDTVKWKQMLDFVVQVSEQVELSDDAFWMGVVTFGTFGEIVAISSDYYDDLPAFRDDIRNIDYYAAGNNIAAGLEAARTECLDIGRPHTQDIVLLLTDKSSEPHSAYSEATKLREAGARVVVVGVGDNVDTKLLQTISNGASNYFQIADFAGLVVNIDNVLGIVCVNETKCGADNIISLSNEYPFMVGCPVLSPPLIVLDQFKFECSIQYSTSSPNLAQARFVVIFAHDNVTNIATETVVIPPNNVATLHQFHLKGNLGKKLSCQVQSYWENTPRIRSPTLSSRSYWTGITFSHNALILNETDNDPKTGPKANPESAALLYVFSTLPVLCSTAASGNCSLGLHIRSAGYITVFQHNENTNKTRKCYYKILQNDWRPDEHLAYSDVSPLQVKPMRMGIQAKLRIAEITMTTDHQNYILDRTLPGANIGVPYNPWDDYKPTAISVHVQGAHPRGLCSVYGDPRINSFDSSGSRTDRWGFRVQGQGIYTLLRIYNANLQIQTHVIGYENKGVAINDAGEITLLTYNDAQRTVRLNKCKDVPPERSRSTVTTDSAGAYFVSTSAGVIVKIDASPKWFSLQIFIDTPPEWWGHTFGLCGSFDGNAMNDMENLSQDDFLKNYRVSPAGENAFECVGATDNPVYPFCRCANNPDENKRPTKVSSVCGQDDPVLLATIPQNPVTLLLPHFVTQNRGRRKRSVSDMTDDIDYDYVPPQATDNEATPIVPPPWGTYAITEAEATESCTRALTGSRSYDVCRNIVNQAQYDAIFNSCMEDIQVTGDVAWADEKIGIFKQTCQFMILAQASETLADLDDPFSDPRFSFLLSDFMSSTCPEKCYERGTCSMGVCQCPRGYSGPDCTIIDGSPPMNVAYTDTDFCDIHDRPCRKITLSLDNVAHTDELSCRVNITVSGVKQTQITRGQWLYPGKIQCELPADMPNSFSYSIAVSRNGSDYTEAQTTAIRQVGSSEETVQLCINQQVFSDLVCIIDDVCHADGERFNSCYVCDPRRLATGWSYDSGCDYGSWSAFSSCSKTCDFGIRTRTRECLVTDCQKSQLIQTEICNKVNCAVENDDDIPSFSAELHGIGVDQFPLRERECLYAVIRLLNNYTLQNPNEFCPALGLTNRKYTGDTAFQVGDLSIGTGYPKRIGDQSIKVKFIVTIAVWRTDLLCRFQNDRKRRAINNDTYFVSGHYVKAALEGLAFELSEIYGSSVAIKFAEPIGLPDKNTDDDKRLLMIILLPLSAAVVLATIGVITWRCITHKKKRVHDEGSTKEKNVTLSRDESPISANAPDYNRPSTATSVTLAVHITNKMQ